MLIDDARRSRQPERVTRKVVHEPSRRWQARACVWCGQTSAKLRNALVGADSLPKAGVLSRLPLFAAD